MSSAPLKNIRDARLGRNVRIMDFVNIYGCSIGDETLIGPFVEIQSGASIGPRCKIESHSFICSGTRLESEVFVGHNVTFTNDRRPSATTEHGDLKTDEDWNLEPVVVETRAAIGSGAVILPGVRIGREALIGAGAVVTVDVPPHSVVAGNPARLISRPAAKPGIGLVDLGAELAEIRREVEWAIRRVVESGRYVGGPEVVAFEAAFSAVVGHRPVAAVNSGTDALRLGLTAMGVGPGDEVIVPAHTFTATVMAVQAAGATPVIADVDPETYVVTPAQIEPLLGPSTKCVIPVHLYGHPAPMDEIMELAESRDIAVLEDAAQAHGAALGGRPVGAWGRAAAFSFYPSKNLGAYGDGGAVTGDREVVESVRMLADLGRDSSGEHVELASNSRLDALQAAILLTKLPHLADWNARRRGLAMRYRDLLQDAPISLPVEADRAFHVYHLFVVRTPRRDEVLDALQRAGVHVQVHYPTPVHLQRAHAGRVKVPMRPRIAERLCREVLSLPLYPQMTHGEQDRVVAALQAVL